MATKTRSMRGPELAQIMETNGKEATINLNVTTSVLEVTIPRLNIETFRIRLVGDSPLICNRFTAKARQQMLEKHMKVARQAKEA